MNSEQGQALPLALIALTVGVLVVTPFLGHAGSALIGSAVYRQVLTGQYSSDAGVEHALWRLTNDGLAEELSNPGDSITYQLGEAVNGVAPIITVTANQTGGGSPGEIGDSIIDTFDFGDYGGESAKVIHIGGDVYAVVYTDGDNDGWLKTVEVTADGDIADAALDSLEFDTANGREPDIVPISGDIYAIAYRGQGDDGWLVTVEIASDGAITDTAVDSFEFDTKKCLHPELVHVSGDIYAIAYQGSGNDGWLKTVEISAGGEIGGVIDTLEFDTANGREPDIVPISGDIYAIAYRGQGDDGWLVTVEITASGIIADEVVDSLEFDSQRGYYPDIIPVSGDVYAIAYTGTSQRHGILTTVEIVTGGATSATYEIVSVGGGVIRAVVEVDGGVASILSWQID